MCQYHVYSNWSNLQKNIVTEIDCLDHIFLYKTYFYRLIYKYYWNKDDIGLSLSIITCL